MSDTPQQRVIEKQLGSLKVIIESDETVRWFACEAFSRGLIDSSVHKATNAVGSSPASKAASVWNALLNRMKTGDSEHTFRVILEIFRQETSMRYVVEKLEDELRSEIDACNSAERNKAAPVRSAHGIDAGNKCLAYPTSLIAPVPMRSLQEETSTADTDSGRTASSNDEGGIQEEQSSASAQLVTPQQAQTSYDNFDRAIEQIQSAKLASAAKDEEISVLKLKYEEKCNEVKRLTSELEQSHQEKRQLCEKIGKLENKVDKLGAEIGDLKSRVKELEEYIKDKEVEKERLLKEKAMMEIELVRKELDLCRSEVEKERLKREAAENQSRIAVFQAKEEIQKQSLDHEHEIELLQRQFSQHSLCKEVEILRQQSTDKDVEIESLQNELQVMKSKST